jgi:hypothetical protein
MHMIALVALYLSAAPLAPLNPLEQDTLPAECFHVSAGVAAGNGVFSTGPEMSAMFEIRPIHPMLVRWELIGRVGSAGIRIWPSGTGISPFVANGSFQSATLGVTALYYRGTTKMTAYIGMGAVYTMAHFAAGSASRSSLSRDYGVNSVSLNPTFGYQLLLGLRYRKSYTLEIGVIELRPDAEYRGSLVNSGYFTGSDQTRLGGFHISIGRIWTIRTR